MKNQKGVTLMILVVTIITMGLIAGTISYNSVSTYRLNAYHMMCSDIELLDEKIALYYLEHKALPIIQNDSIRINNLITDYNSENVNFNPNNSGNLYKIDLTKLDNLSLQKLDYYIDEQSHTIYSGNGKKIEDQEYYTVPTKYELIETSQYQ